MKKSTFCEYCMKETNYKIKEMTRASILNDNPIKYECKIPFCVECNNEIYVSEIYDQNIRNLYDEYRNLNNILSINDLKDIMYKYDVSGNTLDVILDLKKGTIDRYINGDMITIDHSNSLKKIQYNINYFSMILKAHKDKMSATEYSKSRKKLERLENIPLTEPKIESIVNYILKKCEDIDSRTIFNLLYYIQSFYFVFYDKFLFEEEFFIYEKGVYLKSLKEKYDFFGEDKVNNEILNIEEIDLNIKEVNLMDNIIKYFACFSDRILSEMIKSEAPWILTKKNFIYLLNSSTDISTDNKGVVHKYLISAYFSGIKERYNNNKKMYIENYSNDTFEKIQE